MSLNPETQAHAAQPIALTRQQPRIYGRAEHPISRRQISDNALKVLYRLDKAGFRACLVGGSVRDLLLGCEPKDFDVATDASPEQVRELFRNSRLIGRRFRLAHVRFGREVIEVATFRAPHTDDQDDTVVSEHGRILRDNVYGDIDDDVWRRDFSVNALYYDIRDFSVIDYVGGVEDARNRRLRLIGDPDLRYREDPVRMLRAVRFATKLEFTIEAATSEPFGRLGYLLETIAPARLFDETVKLFHSGAARESYDALRAYRLFHRLFPLTDDMPEKGAGGLVDTLVSRALENTDRRIAEDKPVTPAFLFAALLWRPTVTRRDKFVRDGMSESDALRRAADLVVGEQTARIAVPRRFSSVTREIWSLQGRLARRSRTRVAKLMEHVRFRAAYDFLVLRGQAGEEAVAELAEWWTRYQDADAGARASMVDALRETEQGGRRGRRGRSRR